MVSEKSTEKVANSTDSKIADDKKEVDSLKTKDAKLKPVEDEDLVKLT